MKENNTFNFGNSIYSKLGLSNKCNKYDFDYYNEFDINKKNDSHAAIARQVTDNSVVLDIGCSTGIIGKILKEQKKCVVDGIEYDKITYEIAKRDNIYRNIYNFSINKNETEEYKKFFAERKKYDYIIFGDVLEHLYNPWDVLVNVSDLLQNDGKIIISLPNIAHIDILKGLINNQFNYNSVGLLDNTHIRFFTIESFADMIKNISKEKNIHFSISIAEKIISVPKYIDDSKIYELFNIDDRLEEFLVLQNIFVLTKEKNSKNMSFKNIYNKNKYFDRMNEYYTALLLDRKRLEKENVEKIEKINQLECENEKNKQELNLLKKDYDDLYDINKINVKKYNEIINSRRWKVLNKFLRFFGK